MRDTRGVHELLTWPPRRARDEVRRMLAAPASIPGRRVLVVDDHPDSADASCMLLSALGHVCSSAMSGEEALAEAVRFQPNVVICDIGLPDISGYEVARALRTRHGSRICFYQPGR